MKRLFMNRKGQGTTEYVVILAIAIGLIVTIFWPKIKDALNTKVVGIASDISKAGK